MKGNKHMKTIMNIIYAAFAAITLAFFALSPTTEAVTPAPDGGYAGGNTAEGQNALLTLTSGGYNTAVGYLSLSSDTTGSFNTGVGAATLLVNTGDQNTATGVGALLSNAVGNFNTADGALALSHNTIGSSNTATGVGALLTNTIGIGNTANGAAALFYNGPGNYNTAYGNGALSSNTTGGSNTANGVAALQSNSTGNSNIALGAFAGLSVSTASNVISIGVYGANVSNSCYIGNIAGQTVGAGGTTCYVDNDGKLGVFLSARRFKTDIADMSALSEALLALRPVTFHYKPELDKTGIPQFGLVAEEVEAVSPDLVTRDKQGKVSTVRYEAINVMLLNEFLKEHKRVHEQQATISQLKQDLQATAARQQKQIEALTAGLQKVSAQVELNKSAPQTVLNSH
jgi:hypothetical protein